MAAGSPEYGGSWTVPVRTDEPAVSDGKSPA